MRLILIIITAIITGCSTMPGPDDAENGVVCWRGSSNGSYPAISAQGEANGVWLDADVDVTQVSADQWIALYRAFCLGEDGQ